jgi:acyl-CoA hydrolase
MGKKTAQNNKVYMTEIVLPNDSNPLGILLGGRLLNWMDIAAAICAQNHAGNIAVTASIDSISFTLPIKIGNIVYLKAQVTRVFNTSLEVYVQVWKKEIQSKRKQKTNEAFFTFVALDNNGKPIQIEQISPQKKKDLLLFESAVERRKSRVKLGKKKK